VGLSVHLSRSVRVVPLLSQCRPPSESIQTTVLNPYSVYTITEAGSRAVPRTTDADDGARWQGGFALLQNCHLGLAFMEEVIETLTVTENIHDTFRLWITTEEHKGFPIGLLQVTS